MNDKVLIYSILGLLGIGMLGVLFVAIPWVFGRGFSNWKQLLIDDGLIIMAIGMFVYGFYMNTKMH
jgi:hypothetical protein